MKLFFALLLIIGFSTFLLAQETQKPEWVKLFQQGKTPVDTTESYLGIGSSSVNQEDADARARHDFGLGVEVRIQNAITRNVQEVDNVLRDEYTLSAKMSSDIVLRGVTITERFEDKDEKKYYAWIRLRKSVFDTLLVTEIRRDLERKKAENRINEERRLEEIRSQQAALEIRKKEEETRRAELELERKQYEDFLKLPPPDQVVDMRNGAPARKPLTIGARMSLSPITVQSGYCILSLWHFELSTRAYFQWDKFLKSDMLQREEAAFKIQLLDRAGESNKTSLAFGLVAYSNASTLKALDTLRPKYSLFMGGTIALPKVLASYASFSLDKRKACAGLTSFPFPGHFKDAVSLLLQVDCIWDNDWRNRFSDPVLVQAGIRFRASDSFATSFAYENNEFIVVTIEMGL